MDPITTFYAVTVGLPLVLAAVAKAVIWLSPAMPPEVPQPAPIEIVAPAEATVPDVPTSLTAAPPSHVE